MIPLFPFILSLLLLLFKQNLLVDSTNPLRKKVVPPQFIKDSQYSMPAFGIFLIDDYMLFLENYRRNMIITSGYFNISIINYTTKKNISKVYHLQYLKYPVRIPLNIDILGVKFMSKPNKKDYLIIGFITAFSSFILLFIGIKFILGNEVVAKNIIAFAAFSILAGMTTSLLMFYRLRIVYTGFLVGLAIGFLLMYRTFLQEASDWRDLIGLLSLFAFTIVGLGVGALAQSGYHLFKKYKL